MTSHAAAERAALVRLLTETPPDAPTLCTGWTAHHMAAHLVVRDRQPLALPGLVLPPLHRVTESFEQRALRTPYADLVRRLEGSRPLWAPGPLQAVSDLHEWFVHHEDVRRASGEGPRELSPDLERALWSRLQVLGRGLLGTGRRTRLVTPAAQAMEVGRPGRARVVRGRPGELLLWAFGRRDAADVEVEEPA